MKNKITKILTLAVVLVLSLCFMLACDMGNINNNGDSVHEHDYKEQVYYATCESAGVTVYTCACGDTYTQEIQPGHPYEHSNQCSVCGYVDTQYFTFTLLENDTYSIQVTDVNNIPAHVVIPSEYNNKAVTSIGSYAFEDCSSLTSIVIYDSVNSIGNHAFFACSNLTSVVIGDSVTSIGSYAFEDCSSLTSVVIPDSVTSIGSYAFNGCSGLTSVVIPDSVTSIGGWAFSYCSSLTSVVIPDSVTSIGSFAFSACYRLVEVINKSTNITVTKGGTDNGRVGYYALSVSNCDDNYVSKLSNDKGYIIYTDGAEKILIGYIGNQTELVLPTYITQINQYAFYDCDSLTSVVIPNSVTSIGDYAFNRCDNLTSVVIPDGVTSIGDYAFSGCSSLTRVDIPNSVTTIGSGAFADCSSLTKVVIPDSVTTIGASAFELCSSLELVVLPAGITYIPSSMFMDSTINILVVPSTVTSVGFEAFFGTRINMLLGYGSKNDFEQSDSYFTTRVSYYYSEQAPTEEGNFWHYDENGDVAIWEVQG